MSRIDRICGLCLIFLFAISNRLSATHNRAGDITIEQVGACEDLTIKATITTYTKASSVSADRDTLTICWGDGKCEKVPRDNSLTKFLPNDVKLNIYTAFHTYAGRGTYRISMTDPNRIDNIININGGRSVQIPFYIETVYTFLNAQFQGCNSSPVLLQPPIDVGCVGEVFIHNPNAYDPDDDSLSYHLVVPYQSFGTFVPNYKFPNEINPGANNAIDLNEVNGDFIWSAPQFPGDYNIAILIVEYRNGIPIDSVIRDMQIRIEECDNRPPEITAITEICVVAGAVIEFPVVATAPLSETRQRVELQAFGGPFYVDDPAEFIVDEGYQDQPLRGIFRWQTTCNHISDQYYLVIFRAADDYPIFINNQGRRDTSYLSTLQTVRIKVLGPAPDDLRARSLPGQVELSWASPYACENAEDEFFFGFSVWRREGSNQFPIDSCEGGLDGKGYQQIVFRTRDVQNGRYVFFDNDVERGRTYCYRVLGKFAKRTSTGQPYNLIESLPSQEVCVQLSRDLPLITHVDVQVTDALDGRIELRWSKPRASDLDTLQNPGPYRYQVLRATGITDNGFVEVPGASFIQPSFAQANDTIWTDASGLNTVVHPYSYKIAFYVAGESTPLGDTENASSVFLTVSPTDNQNDLSWQADVPWENIYYAIYRDDDGDAVFDSIGFSLSTNYSDSGLVNGQSYCYYIKSVNSYGIEGIVSPIINKSQRVCSVPFDNVPPCPPPLTITNLCDLDTEPSWEDVFENLLRWNNPAHHCNNSDDVRGYRVYYAPAENDELQQMGEIDYFLDTIFMHQPELGLAGCYAVTAFDSIGNESAFSQKICVDNCPIYRLPNAFTPNGDQQNDLFRPYPYRFIDRVEFQVFNRWGNLVFQTKDPALNWDGKNMAGKDLAEGTYFYSCKVFEKRVAGIVEQAGILSGYIELIRAQ